VRTRPPRDPENPFDDRQLGLAMLCVIVVCAITGCGVGLFLQEPAWGAVAGGAAGVVLGVWLVPTLMRDWRG
jgi:hypothetical protein